MKKVKKPHIAVTLSAFMLLLFWASFAITKSMEILLYETSPLTYILIAVVPILIVFCFLDFRRFVGEIETIALVAVFLALMPLISIEAATLFIMTALIDGTLIFLTCIEWLRR